MDTDEQEELDREPLDVPAGEPETTAEKIVARTPWWSISFGMHLLAVLVLSFLIVLGNPNLELDAVVVSPPRTPRELPEMTPPRDLKPNKKLLDMEKAAEDPVFRRDAEESDHNETADEEEFEKAKGDSLDFVSDKPFKGRGTYDVIGGGAGGGGRYGGRLGGKRNLVARGGGGGTQDAVLAALRWLARHQNADGSWRVQGYTGECGKIRSGRCVPNPSTASDEFDMGVTSLSLLAFLGAGYSHLSRDTYDGICFGDVVRRGVQLLMEKQDPEGCVGSRECHKYMYNHAIAALVLAEAFGLTGSNLFRDQAQKAIDFLAASQNQGRGWRYSYKCGDNDSSVTGWAVMALKSAELSGLRFPLTAYDGARNWLDEVTDENYYRAGYTFRGTGKVYCGHNQDFDHHEALTAIAVMSRIFMEKSKQDPRVRVGCDLLLRDLPKWDGYAIDFYYWYYASLALFQYTNAQGPGWDSWNGAMKEALVKHQNTASSGCKDGSWEPVGRWCCEGGRVYATAINALTLEVYYRYANVFVGDRK